VCEVDRNKKKKKKKKKNKENKKMMIDSSFAFVICLISFFSFVICDDESSSSATSGPALQILGLQNFSSLTATGDWLLLFHADYEGHSKRFMPTMRRVAAHLRFLESPVGVASVECTKNLAICQAYNIFAYPTIKLKTTDGDVVEFKGRRELDVMRDFVFEYNDRRNLDRQKISDERRAKKLAADEAKKSGEKPAPSVDAAKAFAAGAAAAAKAAAHDEL
jgi:thiol-disulfide isomerase/thioredoxin